MKVTVARKQKRIIQRRWLSAGAAFLAVTVLGGYGWQARLLSERTLPPLEATAYQFAPVQQQVTAIGRWMPREAAPAGVMTLLTINQGAELRFKVGGTTQLWGEFMLSKHTSHAPTLALSVNGEPYQILALPQRAGRVRVKLLSELDAHRTHTVSLIADGIHEHDPVWTEAAGLMLRHLDAGTGTVTPWVDQRPAVIWIGTSIFAGIMARGLEDGSSPHNSAASLAYPVLTSRGLDVHPVVIAFGATGVTQNGSGGVPPTEQNVTQFQAGRPYVFPGGVAAIVIGEGVNDRNATSSQYRVALTKLIETLRVVYPGTPVFLEGALNGQQVTVTRQVAQATRTTFIDTSAWQISTTDGVHPDLAGHRRAATFWRKVLVNHPDVAQAIERSR